VDWSSWLGITLITLLVLCCIVPMMFMRHAHHRHGGAGGHNHPGAPKSPTIVLAMAGLLGMPVAAIEAPRTERPTVEVYKTPACSCCVKWVNHLRKNGFRVSTTDLDNLDAVKAKYGVPADFGSCHTATVSGYVVEGHVPASDIRRLLKERPKIAGIAVPSMPAGSPGMEVVGRKVQPYRVLTFDKNGSSTIYAVYGGARR
jgi:hypothetical protein